MALARTICILSDWCSGGSSYFWREEEVWMVGLGLKSVHGSFRNASSSHCGSNLRFSDKARVRISDRRFPEIKGISLRNRHWSENGTNRSSTKQELPARRAVPWSGSAIRFPKPPFGSRSWFGNIRSYDFSPISGLRSIVSVRTYVNTSRTNRAGCGSSKKNQRWAPLPERERSRATGRPISFKTSHIDALSERQLSLSRSIAANFTVSSGRSG